MGKKSAPIKKKRATKASKITRVEEVVGLLLQGRSRTDILRHAEREWKLATRQTDEYIKLATAEIDEANLNTAERNLSVITGALWKVYRENQFFKPGVARQSLMDIARLRGLDKLELNVIVERPLKELSDDDLANVLQSSPEAHE